MVEKVYSQLITLPYNEILPTKKAHDLFLCQEAAALSSRFCVELICGRGSLPDKELFSHYGTSPFSVRRLPIIRKNNAFNLSWNRPFFHSCQRHLKGTVLLSVPKQAAYHLRRRKKGVRYIYEVHQLSRYDGSLTPIEQEIFDRADLLIVTTEALKRCIKTKTPIAVIPLAVDRKPLPKVEKKEPFILTYVGQLYSGQGVEALLKAAKGVELHIVGGRPEEIARLRPLNPQAIFHGFLSPREVEEVAKRSHAFIAPFELTGRMPFVAHTKLHEYANWGRPFIAPDAPITREHFSDGVVFFQPGGLEGAIEELLLRYEELCQHEGPLFSWERRLDLMTPHLLQ